MALPPADVEQVQQWCARRVPPEHQARTRISCRVDPAHLTIIEEHPPWDGAGDWTSSPVARLRWAQSRREWSLLCVRGDLRFRPYELARPAATVAPLLAAVERDETGIFWG
ncbi:MAG TPA: DUF3024 domain-containing protein [Mycobacteriales bacterium]|nr:DUF3024 domain-containing protein [Mycobacteriales bacterium]